MDITDQPNLVKDLHCEISPKIVQYNVVMVTAPLMTWQHDRVANKKDQNGAKRNGKPPSCHGLYCLNFVSSKYPGGAFTFDGQTKEEVLASTSQCCSCRLQQPDYYDVNYNFRNAFFQDFIIYLHSMYLSFTTIMTKNRTSPWNMERESGYPGLNMT